MSIVDEVCRNISESFVEKYILRLKDKQPGTAFDIGANYGGYTDMLAAKFDVVYAFEPHPNNIKKLHENVKCPNVKIIPQAISNKTESGRLFTSRTNPGGHSISQVVADKKKWGHDPKVCLYLEFVSIDDFVSDNNITDLSFMKVDIEGAEEFIFEGAINTLNNNKLDIMLETHQVVDCDKLHRFFLDLGYIFYDLNMDVAKRIEADRHFLVSNSDNVVEWEG